MFQITAMLQAMLVISPAMSQGIIGILFLSAILLLVSRKQNKYIPGAVIMISVSIFILLALSFYQFVVDDVYISLRYARNLANGHGLVFSTDGSRPVEGYTNFLWVLMETPLFWMRLSDEKILDVIKIIGIAFGVGIILLMYYLMRLLEFDQRVSLTASLFLSIVPEFSFWAVGGLETTMYIFWMLAALFVHLREYRSGRFHTWSALLFFLLAITRPEGLFIAGALLGYQLVINIFKWKRDPVSTRAALGKSLSALLIFAVLYGVYFAWRFTTYGYLFPNTYYAKRIGNMAQVLARTHQINGFMGPLFPLFAIASIGMFQFKKRLKYEKGMLGLLIVLLLAFCWMARLEWMPGHRYEVPFVPVLMMFFAAGMSRILFNDLSNWKAKITTRMVPAAVMFCFGAFMLIRSKDLRIKGNEFATQLKRAHVPLGKWLKTYAPADASYASWDMGAVPYFSELPVITDINMEGLLNLYTTHHGYDIDKLLSQNPSFLVLPPNTAYVQPRDILDFYDKPGMREHYVHLFEVAFDRDYILHVYKHRNVVISARALQDAKRIAAESRKDILY